MKLLKVDISSTALKMYRDIYPKDNCRAIKRFLVGVELSNDLLYISNGLKFTFRKSHGHKSAGVGRYVLIAVDKI